MNFNYWDTTFLFLLASCVINYPNPNAESLESPKKILAVYYENSSQYRPPTGNRKVFSPQMIDPSLLTDIYFAFAYFGFVTKSINPSNPHLTGDFSIQPIEWNDQTVLYPQIMALKQRSNNGLKVFLSIGGWNFNDPNDAQGAGRNTYRLFSQMVSTDSNRKQFIDSAIAYSHKYGFDGIDIDWEFPGDSLRGGSQEDFPNFLIFLKECHESFLNATPPLLLSFTSPASVPSGLSNTYKDNPNTFFRWIADCSHHVDRVNIMAYDYHGPFEDPKITGANAPLNRDTNPLSTYYIAKTLDYYLENGVQANKILLGMPTFGHSYAGVQGMSVTDAGPGKPYISGGPPGPSTRMVGFLSYYEIADMIAQNRLSFGTDVLTSTAYGYQLSSQAWVSFDTPDTIALKTQMALSKGLGGVMLWTVDMDEYQWAPTFPNIRSAWKVLNQ